MEWQMEDVFKVINLYNQFPCLWNYQDCNYKRVDKKKNAWQEISKCMGKDEEIVKKKMKHLRSAYFVEKKKVESSKKSGSASDDIYIPHLFYFNEMNFLDPVISLRNTTSNLNLLTDEPDVIEFSPTVSLSEDSQLNESEEQCLFHQNDTPVSSKSAINPRKRKAERDLKVNYAIDAFIKRTENNEKETKFSHFAKYVKMQLGQMDHKTAMEVILDIQNIFIDKMPKSNAIEHAMQDANIL